MRGSQGRSAALGFMSALVLAAVLCVLVFGLQRLDAVDDASAAIDDAPSASAAPTTSASASASANPSMVPSAYSSAAIDALLEQVLVVADRPDIPGYDRDCGPGDGCVFGTEWNDDTGAPDGHNGCDTRNDVLAEQLLDVTFAPGSNDCDVVSGHFTDPYTGAKMDYATEGSQIHVDHLFPLAAAWDLGATEWTIEERTRFANDTEVELLAVDGSANMSKGDSTPASWLPPVKAYRCEYVTRYLTVALAYDLAITQADRTVIGAVQRKYCPA